MERNRSWMGAAVVIILASASQLRSVFQVLGGDDIYVLESLRSTEWSRRLFAFNLDTPAAGYMPWWTGLVLQRRFIRVPSSALLWLESELFGLRPIPYHLVTLALVVGSCLLLFFLLSHRVSAGASLLASVVPVVHPAAAEVVGSLNCQPLALAGFFAVATVVAWYRMRQRASIGILGLTLLLCALSVMSYEAAVVLPVFVVLTDLLLGAPGSSVLRAWGPRLAVLGVDVAYLPWAIWIRRGLAAPDTTPVRPLSELVRALHLDSTEYGFKALGLFDPTSPSTYWLNRMVGETPALMLAGALLLTAIWRSRSSRLGRVGLIGFALFLAPPLLTRATVSGLNLPLLRQLYLPVLMGVAPFLAALVGVGRALSVAIPVTTWLAALAVESAVASGFPGSDIRRRQAADSTEQILAGAPIESTAVGVGDDTCGFAPSLVWPGPSVLGIPARVDDPGPELTAVDAHTLIARSKVGFNVRTEHTVPQRAPGATRGPVWIPSRPVNLVVEGQQRIPGATVTLEARTDDRITALRYSFDRPLAELVFIRFRGCSRATRMTPNTMP